MFTEGRRKFLTKAILNLLPVVAAAAFATSFFIQFHIFIRVSLAVTFVALIVLGFVIAPDSLKEGG